MKKIRGISILAIGLCVLASSARADAPYPVSSRNTQTLQESPGSTPAGVASAPTAELGSGFTTFETEKTEKKENNSIVTASGERLATAIGHYERCRSLLIAAVHEFDRGRNQADPKALINVPAWRTAIIDRIEDLDKVLAPQARATRSGVQFEADTRLLREAGRQ